MNRFGRKFEPPARTDKNADKKSAQPFVSSLIPKSLYLGGLKISVNLDESLVSNKRVLAEARYAEQLIIIDPTAAPLQSIEQAYFHELIHWIFFIISEDELRNNEKLVDLVAHFLYQALMTSEPMPAIDETPEAAEKA